MNHLDLIAVALSLPVPGRAGDEGSSIVATRPAASAGVSPVAARVAGTPGGAE